MPYAPCKDVEKEYERLVESDILFPVMYSEWASPAVHVPKETKGSVRVCGDYKKVNELLEDDGYKLPNVQEMLAKLSAGGDQPQVFSVLDLAGAFNQLLLDENHVNFSH